MNLPINREQAVELLKKHNSNPSDFNHFFESEAVMREVAEKLGENVEYWGMLGLLHDIDWGYTEDTDQHLKVAPRLLKEAGFDEKFIEIVVSHGYGFDLLPDLKDKKRTTKLEHALACCETITGLIHAYALMRNKKISDMKVKGLKKKFKDKTFAKGISRDIIRECEDIGLELDEFFELSIKAISKIKNEVGLE